MSCDCTTGETFDLKTRLARLEDITKNQTSLLIEILKSTSSADLDEDDDDGLTQNDLSSVEIAILATLYDHAEDSPWDETLIYSVARTRYEEDGFDAYEAAMTTLCHFGHLSKTITTFKNISDDMLPVVGYQITEKGVAAFEELCVVTD